jgi:hypothetical protein
VYQNFFPIFGKNLNNKPSYYFLQIPFEMNPSECHINALLANTNSSNQFNQRTVDRLAPVVDKVIVNSKMPVKKALFIYYAAMEENCEVYLQANIQKLFDNVKVECITPGMEAEMIDQAECLVVGGGSLVRLATKMAPFAMNIWQKVVSGAPFIGVNEGAEFLSSVYLNLPSALCAQFDYFPLQFLSGYSETPTGMNGVRNVLNNNQELLYALCMPASEEGGGIVLEDAKTGLAGNNTDWGGGPPPGTSQELYIFERDGTGGIREVSWSEQQRKNLPVNYW